MATSTNPDVDRSAVTVWHRVTAALSTGVRDAVVLGRHERQLGASRADGRQRRRRVWAVALGVYGFLVTASALTSPDDSLAAIPALVMLVAIVGAVWRPLDAWRLGTASLVVLHVLQHLRVDPGDIGIIDVTTFGWAPLLLLAAVAAPGPVLLGVWVVSAVALALMSLMTTGLDDPDVALPLLALSLLVGTALRIRRDARDRVAEAGELTQVERDARIAMAERARIAREMHDLVAHHLSAVAVRAETAPYRRPGLPPEALEELHLLAVSAREAMQDMQSLLGVLRAEDPPTGTPTGAPDATGTAGDQDGGAAWRPQPGEDDLVPLLVAARGAGTDVTWTVDLDRRLPDPVALTLYRALAQGLANARQHAAGAPVRVTLRSPAEPPPAPGDHHRAHDDGAPRRSGVRLTIASAPGLDHGPGSGLGLPALHERIGVHAGLLVAGPAPEGGFVLDAWAPWAPVDAHDPLDTAAIVTTPTTPIPRPAPRVPGTPGTPGTPGQRDRW